MKRLLIALAFASVIPALHTLYNYPWRDGYLITSIIYATLIGACGYAFSYGVISVVSTKRRAEVVPTKEDRPPIVCMVRCPTCPQYDGRTDYLIYDATGKYELITRECDRCGNTYNGVRRVA